MKKEEMKKIIPAICVFVFVAFCFVIANAFGDTYAAESRCPINYNEMTGASSDTQIVCCPGEAKSYLQNQCWTDYSSGTSCPSGYESSEDTIDGYSCFAEPHIINLSTYTVTLKASGAVIEGAGNAKEESYVISNITSFNYSSYVALKNEYTFAGWSEDGQTGCLKSGTLNLTENITLYACFTENASGDNSDDSTSTTYSATFDPNEGKWKNPTDPSNTDGTAAEVRSWEGQLSITDFNTRLERDGCTINGWKSENQNEVLYSYFDEENNGDTLTAQWDCSSSGGGSSTDTPSTTTYSVTFYDEFGDELDSTTVNSGGTISSFPSFSYSELEHYWAIDGCDAGYEFETNTTVVSNLELYQCYSEGFVVKFYDELRNFLTEVEVFPTDVAIPSDEIPGLNNGNDGFWSETEMCDSEFDVTDELIVDDLELYACYTYDIYFYGLDENEEYEKIGNSVFYNGFALYDVDNVPAEEDLLIDGKVFTNWSTSSNSCEDDYVLDPESELPLNNDGVNLYACYTSGEAILVRFNDMNSNKITEMQVIKGTSVNDTVENAGVKIPTAPTVEGYTFKYWSNGATCTKAYDFDNKVNDALTLTACYNKNASTGGADGEIDNNPGTGSFMLYIAYLVGILSLGYTGYYVFKYVKNNN